MYEITVGKRLPEHDRSCHGLTNMLFKPPEYEVEVMIPQGSSSPVSPAATGTRKKRFSPPAGATVLSVTEEAQT